MDTRLSGVGEDGRLLVGSDVGEEVRESVECGRGEVEGVARFGAPGDEEGREDGGGGR